MSQVQNSRLHSYIQPIALMAVAYVAGSKRFIRYFPGASQGGLCLATGLGVATTLASPHIKTPAFLQTDIEKESAMHSFFRVMTSLALGIFGAYIVAKPLKGRVSFCVHAASRLMGLEVVFGCVFTGISFMQSRKVEEGLFPEETLEEKYKSFQSNTQSWNALSGKERSKFAKEFYDKNFPVLSIEGEFDTAPFETLPNFSTLTINRLEWYGELFLGGFNLTVKQSFNLNQARQSKGLVPVWVEVTNEYVQYALDEGLAGLLHAFYSKSSFRLVMVQEGLREKINQAFVTDGLTIVPCAFQALSNLTLEEIDGMNKEEAQFASDYMKVLPQKQLLGSLSAMQQVSYNTSFKRHDAPCFWIWPLTEEHLTAIQKIDGALEWAHQTFSGNPLAFVTIEGKIHASLTTLFQKKGWRPIPDPSSTLHKIRRSEVLSLEVTSAWDWNQAFLKYSETWATQSPKKQVAFNTIFSKFKIQTIWIWPLTEKHVEEIQKTEGALDWVYKAFIDIPKQFIAIPPAVREPLAKSFKEKEWDPIMDFDTALKEVLGQIVSL